MLLYTPALSSAPFTSTPAWDLIPKAHINIEHFRNVMISALKLPLKTYSRVINIAKIQSRSQYMISLPRIVRRRRVAIEAAGVCSKSREPDSPASVPGLGLREWWASAGTNMRRGGTVGEGRDRVHEEAAAAVRDSPHHSRCMWPLSLSLT